MVNKSGNKFSRRETYLQNPMQIPVEDPYVDWWLAHQVCKCELQEFNSHEKHHLFKKARIWYSFLEEYTYMRSHLRIKKEEEKLREAIKTNAISIIIASVLENIVSKKKHCAKKYFRINCNSILYCVKMICYFVRESSELFALFCITVGFP